MCPAIGACALAESSSVFWPLPRACVPGVQEHRPGQSGDEPEAGLGWLEARVGELLVWCHPNPWAGTVHPADPTALPAECRTASAPAGLPETACATPPHKVDPGPPDTARGSVGWEN